MKVYDGIMQGLEEAIAYNEGKIKARTKTMYIEPVNVKGRPCAAPKIKYSGKIKSDSDLESSH